VDEKQARFRALKVDDVVAVIGYLSTFSDDKQELLLPVRGDLGRVVGIDGDCVGVRVPAKPGRTWNFYACYERDDLRPAAMEELVAWELAYAGEPV
jgi:hypothetical protein